MLICMRTTLDLDDQLMRKVRVLAAGTGRTITSIIELALRELLDQEKGSRPYRLQWVTVPGGPKPGVDLTDRDALIDLMERPT